MTVGMEMHETNGYLELLRTTLVSLRASLANLDEAKQYVAAARLDHVIHDVQAVVNAAAETC